jgi:hypothetical protein
LNLFGEGWLGVALAKASDLSIAGANSPLAIDKSMSRNHSTIGTKLPK